MKKIILTAILLMTTSTFAQVDTDATDHYKQGQHEALQAAGFLAAGMVMVPVEEYLCAKFKVGPKTETTIKVLSGLTFGSLALYSAGHSAWDFRWVGIKLSRGF